LTTNYQSSVEIKTPGSRFKDANLCLFAQREAQVESARTAPQQVIDAQAKSQSGLGAANQSKADVRTAELTLGYTKVYALVSGVIGRKTVELGQRIQPGQTLLAMFQLITSGSRANYKET